METQMKQIRDQQKDLWNKFSPGWKKWDDLTMEFLEPMGIEIVRLIAPKEKELILDVASGTGEPGLTIANMIREGNGKVIATDISNGMLEIACENANKRGINNFETIISDVSDLPFEDNTFDAISCRFGFMFFPGMLQAAKEMVRVLKPGGRIATSVWGAPEKNFWITTAMKTLKKNMDLPEVPKDAPGMFRCAESGLMAEIFKQAGMKNISEKEVSSKLNTGTAEAYWNFLNDVVAPVVSAMSQANDSIKNKIKDEVFDLVNQKYPEGNVAIDSSAYVVYGEK